MSAYRKKKKKCITLTFYETKPHGQIIQLHRFYASWDLTLNIMPSLPIELDCSITVPSKKVRYDYTTRGSNWESGEWEELQ